MKYRETQDIQTIKIMGIGIVFMVLFMGQLLFYTWCRVQCIRISYEISEETERHKELISIQNSLKIELVRLKSPERISEIAKHRLGLDTPVPRQVMVIP